MGGRIRFALERWDSPRHSSHVAQLFSLGIMCSTIHKLFRCASVMVFIGAICLFLHSLMFILPARQLPVTNTEHQIIGQVWIPYDSRSDLKLFGLFIVLSGLQMWTVFLVTKKHDKPDA